ncbi:MAG: transposase [Candidatus Eisenbacteria bacterium]|uniref:Transposase n=1 Tax=Eiseniibacteriota bacterium TaxID=2212470 RepID=A0A849SAH2_UNCEI|nr:transposase [Candidatus Eisenbacteria bacterium]
MNRVKIGRRQRPEAMAGDKACSTPRIRQRLKLHAIRAVISRRTHQHPDDRRVRFDRKAYRRRNSVEPWICWIESWRRVVTRFEQLAVNSLATTHLILIERYFRVQFSNGA